MQIQENVNLSEVLWYKIGGTASYLITVATKQDIHDALSFVSEHGIKKVFVCGKGSNLIFAENHFDGAVIQIDHGQEEQITLRDDTTIESFAGELLDHVITFGLERKLTGLEWAGGLPGTVGAAVRGNVGAYGGEIKDTLLDAEVLVKNADGKYSVETLTNQQLAFIYRGSLIKESKGQMVVLSARFAMKKSNDEETTKATDVYKSRIQNRKDRHPLEYPNCGSVFKNIKDPEQVAKVLHIFPDLKERITTQWYGKVAAGHLIQRLGLQGYKVGNAQVSEKHALFIVNLGGAKAQDVLTIIDTIQNKFMETFGFTLEPEVEIVT